MKNLSVNVPLEEYAKEKIEKVLIENNFETQTKLKDSLVKLFCEMAEKVTATAVTYPYYPEGVKGISTGDSITPIYKTN